MTDEADGEGRNAALHWPLCLSATFVVIICDQFKARGEPRVPLIVKSCLTNRRLSGLSWLLLRGGRHGMDLQVVEVHCEIAFLDSLHIPVTVASKLTS